MDEEITEVLAEAIALYEPDYTESIADYCLGALRAEGFDVVRSEDRGEWKFCPVCGRLNRPKDGGDVDTVYCSPTNCEAWTVSATFDHSTREWVPSLDSEEGT